jgi:hypothetical protein
MTEVDVCQIQVKSTKGSMAIDSVNAVQIQVRFGASSLSLHDVPGQFTLRIFIDHSWPRSLARLRARTLFCQFAALSRQRRLPAPFPCL